MNAGTSVVPHSSTTSFVAPVAQIVHVTDPVAYAISLLLIVGACRLAASIPAARASRVDPMQTLRQD